MKILSGVFVSMLIACGGGTKQSPTANKSSGTTGEGQPCSQEIVLSCPDGQVDACTKTVAEPEKPDDGSDESGGTGTAMALDEGKMGKADAAGTHKCVPK